jgi:hypothetical protein
MRTYFSANPKALGESNDFSHGVTIPFEAKLTNHSSLKMGFFLREPYGTIAASTSVEDSACAGKCPHLMQLAQIS